MIEILKKTITSADGYLLPYNQYKTKDNNSLSIILVYEIFGLTSHINDLALEYAKKGFMVYVPDIFSRLESNINLPYNKEGFIKGIELKDKLGWDLPVMDIVALSATIKQNYNVSILGYCYGGTLAWLAMQKSFMFDKGVCYYGSSISNFLNSKLNCPVTLHFGKKDKGIPPSSIEKIRKYKEKEKEKIDLWEYENADHGFNCNERKSYNKNAADLAFDRTLNFLTSL